MPSSFLDFLLFFFDEPGAAIFPASPSILRKACTKTVASSGITLSAIAALPSSSSSPSSPSSPPRPRRANPSAAGMPESLRISYVDGGSSQPR